VSGSEALKLWDVASGRELRTLSGESSAVTAVAVSPDGRAIVSGGLDLTINLWDDTNGRRLRTLNGHSEYVKAVAFSPDGRTIVSGSKDKTLKLWDVASGRELRTLSGHTSAVNAVAFSPDGRTIVSSGDRTILGSMDTRSCSGENNLKLWDAASGRELRTFNEHSCWIYAVAFSPDGHTIVSSAVAYAQDGRSIDTNSGILRLWDAVSGREIRSFNANSNGVNAVAFSPDGRTIVSGGGDKTLKLWDAASGRELRTLSGHTSAVWAVAFSPDGRAIVSGSGDKTIKLWDAATGQELHTLIGHKGGVLKVSFSPNGRNVISGSGDGTVRQWDVSTEKEIVQFVGFKDGEWVTITPEGYYNSSENGDKHLNVRVGNGLNDVFGLDQYRESFYRPDFVKLALAGGSPSDYGNIVSAKHPPQVRIVDTPESTSDSETKVTLRLTDMGGGIGDVRLYLNGSAVMRDNARSMQVVAKDDSRSVIRTYSVKLINGKNSIRAIAFNSENSVQSVDALHEISALFRATTKPTLHAVVVGINEFANPRFTLKYAVADAELFAESLAKSAAGLFEKVDIIKLTTRQETTSENIKKELMALRSLNPDDLFVFYVASHGQVDDGEYFLITSNVGLASTEHLKTDALTQTELKELIANIPTTKKVIVLDTCNSGAMGDVLKVALLTRGMSEEAAINIFSRAVGSTILSASTSTQEALEGYKEHGLFTFVLAEGLSGKADKGKSGFIKTIDLVDYVETEVPPIAETIYNHKQFPYMSISGQPFYIGKVVMP
jgi:WD40 repeat protein